MTDLNYVRDLSEIGVAAANVRRDQAPHGFWHCCVVPLAFRAPPGPAAACARGRRPAREPSAPRASLGASSRSPARPRHRPRAPQPGLDVTHPHRSLALPPATAPPPGIPNVQLASESPVIRGYVERYTFSTDLSRHFPPLSVPRTLAAQPGPGRWQASSCPLENVAESCPWDPRPGPAAVVCPRAEGYRTFRVAGVSPRCCGRGWCGGVR